MNNPTATQRDRPVDVSSLSDAALLDALDRGFEARHAADSRLVRLAAEVVHRSRSGPDGLASRLGSRSAAALLAEVGRITLAEGQRFCRVAEATADRVSLLGERMPPSYPLVADAVRAAVIPVDSANHIVAALSQASPRAERVHLDAAELALVRFAAENPADMVRVVSARWRDALDVDGIEQREDELVERRSLRRSILANGLKRYRLDLDPVGSAYLDAAIDSQVGLAIRAPRFESPDECGNDHDPLPDTRTLTQIAADAVVEIARHAIACDNTTVPLPAATIVVRMSLEALLSGLGEAQIDGIEQPSGARRRERESRFRRIPAPVQQGAATGARGTGRRMRHHQLRETAQSHRGTPHPLVVTDPRDRLGQRRAAVLPASPHHPSGRLGHRSDRQRAVVHPALNRRRSSAPEAWRQTAGADRDAGGGPTGGSAAVRHAAEPAEPDGHRPTGTATAPSTRRRPGSSSPTRTTRHPRRGSRRAPRPPPGCRGDRGRACRRGIAAWRHPDWRPRGGCG
jgi:hypothetical protein